MGLINGQQNGQLHCALIIGNHDRMLLIMVMAVDNDGDDDDDYYY